MVVVSDTELVRAWESSASAETIAIQLGIPAKALRSHWGRLKAAGRLPPGPRPVGRTRHGEVMGGDGRPTVGYQGGDPLLAKLRQKHSQ